MDSLSNSDSTSVWMDGGDELLLLLLLLRLDPPKSTLTCSNPPKLSSDSSLAFDIGDDGDALLPPPPVKLSSDSEVVPLGDEGVGGDGVDSVDRLSVGGVLGVVIPDGLDRSMVFTSPPATCVGALLLVEPSIASSILSNTLVDGGGDFGDDTGDDKGDDTGDDTGDVTGDDTGDVTGDVTVGDAGGVAF